MNPLTLLGLIGFMILAGVDTIAALVPEEVIHWSGLAAVNAVVIFILIIQIVIKSTREL